MEEEERALLTIGDFFKVIFNRKWIVLAVTIAALLLGTLLTMFVVNPSKQEYQVYFSMEYPGKGKVYPDGKTFRYQDMVSLEYLEAVKATDEKFANIDVEKISETDGISIYTTALTDGIVEGQTNLPTNEKQYEYRFVAKGKYFPDEETASLFLRALASYPSKYNKAAVETVDFNKNLASYGSPAIKRYEDKLSLINKDFDYLAEQYNNLIKVYGSSLKVSIGEGEANTKSLSGWLSDLYAAYGSSEKQSLATALTTYGYTCDDTVFTETTNDLVYELQDNTNKIDNNRELLNSVANLSDTNRTTILATINNLYSRNLSIERILAYRGVEVFNSGAVWTWEKTDLTAYDKYKNESTAFGTKLDGIKTALEKQGSICKSVVSVACAQQAKVTFAGNKLEGLNHTSTVMAAIISLLIGLVAVSVVVLIIDMPKYAKKKREELEGNPQSAPVLVEDEQVAEAAATQTEDKQD